ncbi:hypothetical protein DPMN_102964 [Dreissena polymorpha]|uniref:Uncharacterized protein n=1 Tax=Dreissena polymorpha TaxID=45954 RepID=A0A9D4HA58_DREPO|nr:hypothetical protein DPMN_102964 [Dreissena polymorpha]
MPSRAPYWYDSCDQGIQDPQELDPKLVCPFFDVFCPYLPKRLRRPLRFGVRH